MLSLGVVDQANTMLIDIFLFYILIHEIVLFMHQNSYHTLSFLRLPQ